MLTPGANRDTSIYSHIKWTSWIKTEAISTILDTDALLEAHSLTGSYWRLLGPASSGILSTCFTCTCWFTPLSIPMKWVQIFNPYFTESEEEHTNQEPQTGYWHNHFVSRALPLITLCTTTWRNPKYLKALSLSSNSPCIYLWSTLRCSNPSHSLYSCSLEGPVSYLSGCNSSNPNKWCRCLMTTQQLPSDSFLYFNHVTRLHWLWFPIFVYVTFSS